MPYHWPADTDFALWELDVLDRACPACGRMMSVCDHRYRQLQTLDGPVELICKLNHCPDPHCPGHAKTRGPELEITIAPPYWAIGGDVFCGIGHRRCSRHMALPLIRSELLDDCAITPSEDAIEKYIRRYQVMLAARQQGAELLRRQDPAGAEIILCIDGLRPEKGHEALDVVRELTRKRVWFAEPLLSATEDQVRRLITKAKQWAESLGAAVGLWMSDKQEAFVKGVAAEFPDVPRRYCDNHFLRDLAQPVLEADSHAKVRMRKAADRPPAVVDAVGTVVLDYCAAVRGILNDDQGGPLEPPGLRMAAAPTEVRASIERNSDQKKGGSRRSNSADWPDASRAAWTKSRRSKRSSEVTSR